MIVVANMDYYEVERTTYAVIFKGKKNKPTNDIKAEVQQSLMWWESVTEAMQFLTKFNVCLTNI